MPKRGNTSSLLDKVIYLTRMTGLEGVLSGAVEGLGCKLYLIRMTGLEGVFSGAVEGLGCKLYRIPRLLIGDNKNLCM
jgi:hypothetical protein